MTTQSEKVSAEDVRHVAELANLELTQGEEEGMIRDLNAILSHFDQLNELNVADTPPMAQVTEVLRGTGGEESAAASALRADEPQGSLSREIVMRSAPETDGAFFKVPKVLER
jgi:aspartyl-tRNA(Asn)/glutamyl-tRNA(Gln) amidotransferase subunit C